MPLGNAGVLHHLLAGVDQQRHKAVLGGKDGVVTSLDAVGHRRRAKCGREFHLALVRPSGRGVTIETVDRLLALSERYVRVHLGEHRRRDRGAVHPGACHAVRLG